MNKKFDPSLYLVTGETKNKHFEYFDIVQRAIEGGVSMVQLRLKNTPKEDIKRIALKLKEILNPYKIPLIINDHVDIVQAIDADGVHLGQKDLSIHEARRLLGEHTIIGFSIDTLDSFENLDLTATDYIAASPVFSTNTKKDIAQPLLLSGVKRLKELSSLPLIAIGGLNSSNIADVLNAGADGIALISSIWNADDPKIAAKELRTIIEKTKRDEY